MRVAIVGAGIIGLASAYHLLQDGHDVTLIDAAVPGAGASHGNAGWVVPADAAPVAAPGVVLQALKWMLRPASPLYVRPSLNPAFVRFMVAMARRCNRDDFRSAFTANLVLCEDTLDLLDAYTADGVKFEMHTEGLILAFAEQEALDHHITDLDIPAEHGLEPEVLTGSALAALEPSLRPQLAGGIHFPHERHLRPDALVSALAARCRELDATFRDHAPVTAVRRDSRVHALVTPAGDVTADAVVLAAGAHSGPLSRLFGVRLPVRPGKGYSVDYEPAPVSLKRMVNLADARVAVTPLDRRLRLAGTMEFAGLDTRISPVRVRAIRQAPTRYFTEWDPELPPCSAPWAAARPMTPDGLPIIGRIPGLDNAWVATGHGMFGVTLGPGTGRALASAISNGAVPAALAPFDPRRFRHRRRTTAR
jgi:D-amino-acid dehydrogenase